LWRLQAIDEEEDCEFEYEADQYSECYVSFNKLFAVEPNSLEGSADLERIVII
jgi:hypothetical protein